MKKIKNCVLTLIAAALICASSLIIFASAFEAADGENYWDNEIALNSKEQVEQNFDFHFVSTQNARRTDKFDYTWEIRDGAVCRVGNIDSASDTVNIAIMTYKIDVFDDFDLSVDVKAGTNTPYWPVIGIRQQIPGKYYTTSGGGTGVFMQQNGKITLWGPISNGIFEQDIPTAKNWYPMMWHNMRITAQGTSLKVYVDNSLVLDRTLNSTDYVKGYISLQSVNNNCSFRNFKIKSLSSSADKSNEENKYSQSGSGTPLEDLV